MSENIQYITKANGERIAVIIPLKEYESLLEELGLTAAEYESSEPSRSMANLEEEMRAAGEIDI
jgi:PHD/YefM family antitoxin component YafN of YafNO toxin-antitoxin module